MLMPFFWGDESNACGANETVQFPIREKLFLPLFDEFSNHI